MIKDMILRIAFFISTFFVVWLLGLLAFVMYIASYSLNDNVNADGIVALTGGSGRIEHAFELLASKRGEALFISGVSNGVTLGDLTENTSPELLQKLGAYPLERITLGHAAENTIGNAEETSVWVKEHGYTSLLIVTSDYHMPRSLTELHATMPDVTLIPAAVKTNDYMNFKWIADDLKQSLIISEYNKFIASKLRQWLLPSAKPAA